MADASKSVVHPVFGRLEWRPKESDWNTRYRLPSGVELDVFVAPYRVDRHAFLDKAAKLFRWSIENERRVLEQAVREKLLDLYNEGWREEGEPVLLAEEFTAHLEWQLLKLTANSIVPIEFWYDPGELYEQLGGHVLAVQVNEELQFRGAHLIG